MTSLLVEKAYAKINLGLKVLSRRPDGYHEILSVVQCVDLADVLYFEAASSDQLTCSLDGLSTGPDNLVCRAVEAFRTSARPPGPVVPHPPRKEHTHRRGPRRGQCRRGRSPASAQSPPRPAILKRRPPPNRRYPWLGHSLSGGRRHRSNERPGRDTRSTELGGRGLLRTGVPRCRDQHGVGLWPTRPHLDRKFSLF